MKNGVMNQVITKINDLYILSRYKYLLLNTEGKYITLNKKDNSKVILLNDSFIKSHLNGKLTYGVFAGISITKFICFDVDFVDLNIAKWVVYKIYNALIEIGISEEYIYTSFSGNKGYHVEIFFDKPLSNTEAKRLFDIVMIKEKLHTIEGGKVEYRPTDTQGVKIPLGKNFKSKRKNRCWYVDYSKGLTPIRKKDYILNVKQFNVLDVENIISREMDMFYYSEEEKKDISEIRKEIESVVKPLKIYYENVGEIETLESINKIYNEGLNMQGTRHNSIFKLGKFFRYQGYTEEETVILIKDWMSEQDTRYYQTSWDKSMEDIEETTKYIFEKEISLTLKIDKLEITDSEIKQIVNLKNMNQMLLTYCMLLHSKRYSVKNGQFYMTYKQMSETSRLSEKTVRTLINKLEEKEVIEIVERNRRKIGKDGKLKETKCKPNIYSMNLNIEVGSENTYCIKENQNNNSNSTFKECIFYFFEKKELKDMLPRRQFENILQLAS